MHRSLVVAAALAASPALAQNFYVPDSNPATGTCNVIPFGSTTPVGSFSSAVYQSVVTAADLASTPGLITGLGFAACGTGKARYGMIEVVMDLAPPNTVLSTTFANNLTPAAVTVLRADDYVWHNTGSAWNELGLQNYMVFDGVSDLVVQITVIPAQAPAGFHRDTRQRVYAIGWTGTPPLSGTSGAAALKMEIGMLTARLSQYGDGCLGSNGTPALTVSGSSQFGQTAGFALSSGAPLSVAFLALGFYSGTPFPFDLGALGAPGCVQYATTDAALLTVTDAAGSAPGQIVVPNNTALAGTLFYAQWACVDPAANQLGITTSNYARALVGS